MNAVNQFQHNRTANFRNRNLFFTRSQSYYQKDKRILSSHKSYHIGRFFSIIGSAVILFGLLCKFIVNEEIKDNVPVVTVSVTCVGVVILLVGICFIAITVYKTQMAIIKSEQEVTSGPAVQSITEVTATPHTSAIQTADSCVTINRTID